MEDMINIRFCNFNYTDDSGLETARAVPDWTGTRSKQDRYGLHAGKWRMTGYFRKRRLRVTPEMDPCMKSGDKHPFQIRRGKSAFTSHPEFLDTRPCFWISGF